MTTGELKLSGIRRGVEGDCCQIVLASASSPTTSSNRVTIHAKIRAKSRGVHRGRGDLAARFPSGVASSAAHPLAQFRHGWRDRVVQEDGQTVEAGRDGEKLGDSTQRGARESNRRMASEIAGETKRNLPT